MDCTLLFILFLGFQCLFAAARRECCVKHTRRGEAVIVGSRYEAFESEDWSSR